jgi:hypothetical protein
MSNQSPDMNSGITNAQAAGQALTFVGILIVIAACGIPLVYSGGLILMNWLPVLYFGIVPGLIVGVVAGLLVPHWTICIPLSASPIVIWPILFPHAPEIPMSLLAMSSAPPFFWLVLTGYLVVRGFLRLRRKLS